MPGKGIPLFSIFQQIPGRLMKKFYYLCIYLFLITILTTTAIYAGTTGKIAGKIIDASSKEELIGANITLVGTNYGAASDFEGNFFIINIPPGTYTVKASLIGYNAVTIKDVKVSVDQTTKLDFELTVGAVELENVVVSATKSVIQKDLTSTESKVSGEDISMLPVEDVQSVVNLQAGVVDGHFRGGRLGEVKYLIDGVSANDVFSGTPALQAEVNSIQEVQILTGTFNAEYGEALSGVVNQVTKIAGDNYQTSFSAYTGDYVTSRNHLYRDIDHISPSDIYNLQGSLSGPVPGTGDFVKFFASGRYYDNEGYLYGKRMFNPSDSSNFTDNPATTYVGATGDGAYVPMNYDRRYSLQGKLAFKVGSGRGIVLNTLYSNSRYKDYNFLFQLNPDGDYKRFNTSLLTSLNYTQVFSNAVFLDMSASVMNSEYKQYVYEDPLDPRYVNPERLSDVSGAAFYTGGTQNWHFNHKTITYSGKLDLTAQVNSVHQLKTGIEFLYHDLSYEDYQVVIDATSNYKPALPTPGAFNYNKYQTNPYQFAAYVQDKIELEYLIVNVGLRFDYFEPKGKYLKDANKIAALDMLNPPFPDSLFNDAKAKYQLSPRIGISYPLSDHGAIHVSYGHFFQVPPFEYLYKNPNFRIPLTGNFPENIGNSIGNADLKPQQTVMYEIGLQQAVTPEIAVNLTAYQKDIRNLLSTEIHIKNDFKKFSRLINRDYGSVKGVTLSLEKTFTNGFGASIDYTYQVAKGNASDPNDSYNNAQASPPIETNKQLVALDWDRRHSLNFTFTGGIPGNFIASFVGRLASGMPYTPSVQNQRTGLENSDNRPGIFNVDLYLTKYVTLFNQQISFFLKIYNLFDTANEMDVFSDTGRAGYSLELTRSQEPPKGVNTLQEYYSRPDFYSAPRQIVIGGSYGF
jgi:outer membrane receptor protein involved in Fe transport